MKRSVLLILLGIVFLVPNLFAAGEQEAATQETLEISWLIYGGAVMDDKEAIANDRVKLFLEDKFNFKINLLAMGAQDANYGQRLQVGMAGGTAPDIFQAYIGWHTPKELWLKWIEEQAVVDMGEIVYGEPDRYPTLKTAFDSPMYKMFNSVTNDDPNAFYNIYKLQYNVPIRPGFVLNGRMLEEMGEMIPETYPQFIALLRKAHATFDIPAFGWIAYKATNWAQIGYHFFQPQGQEIAGMFEDAGGKYYEASIDPKNAKIWKEVAGYMAEGLLNPNWLTEEAYDCYRYDFVAQKIFAVDAWSPQTGQYTWLVSYYKEKWPDADIVRELVQTEHPLYKADGTFVKFRHNPTSVTSHTVVPYSTKDPNRVMDLIEYLMTNEGLAITYFGVPGVHYEQGKMLDTFDWKEYQKDSIIYRPDEPFRLEYYFTWLFYGDFAQMDPNDKDPWFDAAAKQQNIRYKYAPQGPEVVNSDRINDWYRKNVFEPLPAYYALINWTQPESEIQSKYNDWRNKWFTRFLTGEADPEKDWDTFVAEYKATGHEQLVAAYAQKIADAEATFLKYSGGN